MADETPELSSMVLLRLPFKADKIKKNYQGFDYVPPEHVIDRLNDVLGFSWEFEITDIKVYPGEKYQEVVCQGRMTIGSESRMGIGADTVSWKTNEGKYYPNPIDKAFKSAASNCMKLCARLFGVGNQLWGGEMMPETVAMTMNEAEAFDPPTPDAPVASASPPSTPPPSQASNGGRAVSPKSYGFFQKLVKEKGWRDTEHAEEIGNIVATHDAGDELSQVRVSKMIDILKPMDKPAKAGTAGPDPAIEEAWQKEQGDDGLPF